MSLPPHWATIEDFATLFQYFWHRDFPIDDKGATGAHRTDWTIHIGVVVRNIGDLMRLVTRFERGGRKDAILRSADGDEIAVEWEWGGVWGNELRKLKNHEVWRKDQQRRLPQVRRSGNLHAHAKHREGLYPRGSTMAGSAMAALAYLD